MMLNTFSKNKGGPKPKYNEVLLKAHEDIQSIHSQEGIDVTLMGGTITDAAEMLSQCARRMVHGQFKKLPSKAIIRQIILAMKKGIISASSKERRALQNDCISKFWRHADEDTKDASEASNQEDEKKKKRHKEPVPEHLINFQKELMEKLESWKETFEDVFLFRDRLEKSQKEAATMKERIKSSESQMKTDDIQKLYKEDERLQANLKEESQLYTKRLSALVRFNIFLHNQRRLDVQEMKSLETSGNVKAIHKETTAAFWKASKSGLLLPLSSYEVKAVRINATTLKELQSELNERPPKTKKSDAQEGKADEKEDEKRKGKKRKPAALQNSSWVEQMQKYQELLKLFPGLEKTLKENRGSNDSPKTFEGSFVTNRCSVSILFKKHHQSTKTANTEDGHTNKKRKERASSSKEETSKEDDSLDAFEDTDTKVSHSKPTLNRPRLISIDPGYRDIITAVAIDTHKLDKLQPVEAAPDSGIQNKLFISNKQYKRASWRVKTQRLTESLQRKVELDHIDLQRYATRLEEIQKLKEPGGSKVVKPPVKVSLAKYISLTPRLDNGDEAWGLYLRYNLPVAHHRIQCCRDISVRKAKFVTRQRTDSFLDKVCSSIIDLGISPAEKATRKWSDRRQPKGSDVSIAFGDASVSSGGFGYSSSAIQRLKHRLEHVHGCKVCLVDEYLTSQMCSSCEQKLVCVGVKSLEEQLQLEKQCKASRSKPPRYGVLKCLQCQIPDLSAKVHWHRDVNAALNIAKVFVSLAREDKRPSYLTPK